MVAIALFCFLGKCFRYCSFLTAFCGQSAGIIPASALNPKTEQHYVNGFGDAEFANENWQLHNRREVFEKGHWPSIGFGSPESHGLSGPTRD